MEAYEIVEAIEAIWDRVAKNVPLTSSSKGKTTFSVFLPVDELRVFAMLAVGSRGGINEGIVVLDPSAAIVVDRLLVKCTDGGPARRGAFFPLTDLRRQVMQTTSQRKELALEICENAMWDFLDGLRTRPLSPAQLRLMESTSESLRWVINAGTPSLGRRGGGTPGSH